MAIDYANMPNGVTKIENNELTTERIISPMERMFEIMENMGYDINNIRKNRVTFQNFNTLKKIVKENNINSFNQLVEITNKLSNIENELKNDKSNKSLDNVKDDKLPNLPSTDKKHSTRELTERKYQEHKQNKIFESFQSTISSFTKVYDKNRESMLGLLGPLNLIRKPLEEFTNKNIGELITSPIKTLFKDKKSKDKKSDILKLNSTMDNNKEPKFGFNENTTKFWNKKSKKRPTSSDLINLGGIGAIGLYIGDILSKTKDVGKKTKDVAIGGLKNIGKFAMKGLGIGSIIASIMMIITDGIAGMLNKDWGGNKGTRFAAGALAGTDKGIKGALKNGGKWALMGAGIGTMIAPGLGTLIGGVIGLVIGGILGAIGGEKLNKFFVKIGKWFNEKVLPKLKEIFDWVKEKVISPIIDTFSKITSIWKGEGSWDEKLLKTFDEIKNVVFNIFNNIKDAIWNHLSEPIQNELLKLKERFVDPLVNTFSNIINIFESDGNVWEKIGGVFKEIFNLGKTLLKSITDTLLESIKSIVNLIKFMGTLDWLHSPIESAKSIIEYIKNGGNNVEVDDSIEPKKTKKTKDGIFSSNNSNQYLIRGNEKIQLDPQDNILVTTNYIGETKNYKRGELNPIINDISNTNNSLSKTSKSEFSKVEQEIKKQNAISNKINNISNVINNNSSVEKSNYKNQLGDIVELLSKILDESKNKIQMPSLTRNDLLQVAGGYF